VDQVGVQDDVFDLGGHSLLAIRALSKINQCCGSALKLIDLYNAPTIRELVERICGTPTRDEFIDLSKESNLDAGIVARSDTLRGPLRAVMLTGCTGFVGRFLLAQLLQQTDATLYCLVRARSTQQAFARIRGTLAKWNLWCDGAERRIVAIPGDLSLPRLGVDEATYQSLCQNIDGIYHCGTSMNHLESYAMARTVNVGGATELLKLATRGKQKLVNYISTLGIFNPSDTTTVRAVNEQSAIDYEKHRASQGYLGSKWVGEKIFMIASERGIPCNIFRLGLVWADTQQGRYDDLQRNYRLFKSCLLSGYGIEHYRYEMPPTPVDYVARAIVFLANTHCDGEGIFHISSTNQLVDDVFERCNAILGTSLELRSYYDWVCEMRRLHHAGRSLPVLPLIEFAFSMDEESFYEYYNRISRIRFDSTETHAELERAGIVAPVVNDDLLRVHLESMFSRDEDLRQQINSKGHRIRLVPYQ
jgi:thioester reductase-like protein